MADGSVVAVNLFLGYWTAESIPGFTNGKYMAVYASLGVYPCFLCLVCDGWLGVANGVFSFLLSVVFS